MNKELPTEDLLAGMAREDSAALSETYDRYAPRVYGMIAHILPSRDAAEEVLQEVFMRLWAESASLSQEGGSVVAWLVVTARAAAVDRLRAQRPNAPGAARHGHNSNQGKGPDANQRRPKAAAPAASASRTLKGNGEAARPRAGEKAAGHAIGPLPAAWLPQPKEITLIDDRLMLLHKAINQLPKLQRQALDLAVFGGCSELEIATEMGEPLGKAQRSLRAAITFVKHRRRAVCGTWAANI